MQEMNDAPVAGDMPMVIEWAPFHLARHATESELLEASEALQREFLDQCPGFLRRELLRGPGGQWADLVFWTDEESAQAATKLIGDSAVCLRYFSFMVPHDPDAPHGGMLHLHRVRSYASAQREPAAR